MAYEIVKGKIQKGLKLVLYGAEGVGKSTFASQLPGAVFIDTEGSTNTMDVARFPTPTSWSMLMDEVDSVLSSNQIQTLVIDTADWAETETINELLRKYQKNGIEDFGYGQGYTYVSEEFGRLLNKLTDLTNKGINVALICHSIIRTITPPDGLESYDHWQLKLSKKVSPMVMEWCDLLLYACFKTTIMTDSKTKKKMGVNYGERVMYTQHRASWDAKNRFNLPEEMQFDAKLIVPLCSTNIIADVHQTQVRPQAVTLAAPARPVEEVKAEKVKKSISTLPKALLDLMDANDVTEEEIQEVVNKKGYYPKDMPVENYDPKFIEGVLIGAWPQVYQMITDYRDLPF